MVRGSSLIAFARTEDSGQSIPRRHALTLLSPLSHLRATADDRVFVCACTHYLVFKEPTTSGASDAPQARCFPVLHRPQHRQVPLATSSGELIEITIAALACQLLFSTSRHFSDVAISIQQMEPSCSFVRQEMPSDEPGSISGDLKAAGLVSAALRCPAAGRFAPNV